MTAYCSPQDLIAHANRAQLISQLSGNDYAPLPEPQAVVDYFTDGTADAADLPQLQALHARCQQAIDLAAGDIDGYLALMPDVKPQLPVEFLTACNLDMALFRLFDSLPEDSVVRSLNNRRHTFFNNILSEKTVVNRDVTPDNDAQTIGDAVIFTSDFLQGY